MCPFPEGDAIICFLRRLMGRWWRAFTASFTRVYAYRFIGLSILMAVLVLSYWAGSGDRAGRSPEYSNRLPAAKTALPASSEIRGVWITNVASSVLFSPWGIARAMHQLADLHFNQVYPVVWNRGHTFYPSPALKNITGQSIDSLLAWAHPLEDPLSEM
ncbi:MAG: family 10 glycosylhydrolase, partial [Phormidesmis sp.]